MQLVRIMADGQAHWGRLDGETVHLLAGVLGDSGFSDAGRSVPFDAAQLLPPATPSKIVCVGRNYADHIREMGHAGAGGEDLPLEPGIFLKGPNALAEPGGSVAYPEWTENFHFEGELALVIGQRCKNLGAAEALGAVLGYTCGLDLTARDKQREDLQWFRAKAADRFCPLGPWLETGLTPTDLHIQTRVNGAVKQDSRTSHMIFDPVQVLVYVSRYVTLEPGDVVLTGTPEGVGPLERGDTVEVEVEGIGVLQTRIV
ncbi:fumarylacetoacetate hydrolase family protein [Deinococcus radiophilus]|uniref:FAA hydrolase family protein n=1 Tax=Deinococcus radiophilus TaxID=32062 RepID=A0A3S0KH50_9DEIO|nr:fumarylacetoacetate hydrolase family protein [Deinococcus radiophilus]RTR30706.1 FAA hydrolase family protein [Deinococcus radiophilus]